MKSKSIDHGFELGRMLYGRAPNASDSKRAMNQIDPEIPLKDFELGDAGIDATPEEILAIRRLQPPEASHRSGFYEIKKAVAQRVKIARSLERHAREIRALLRFFEKPIMSQCLSLDRRGIRTPSRIESDIKLLAALLAKPSGRPEVQGAIENWEIWSRIPTKTGRKADDQTNLRIAKWSSFFQRKSGKPHHGLVARIVYPRRKIDDAANAVKQAMSKRGSARSWVGYVKLMLKMEKLGRELREKHQGRNK